MTEIVAWLGRAGGRRVGDGEWLMSSQVSVRLWLIFGEAPVARAMRKGRFEAFWREVEMPNEVGGS